MFDLPLFDRPSSARMSVTAQGDRRGTHRLCTTRSSATVGNASVMGTAIESQLRVVVPRPVTPILEQVQANRGPGPVKVQLERLGQ